MNEKTVVDRAPKIDDRKPSPAKIAQNMAVGTAAKRISLRGIDLCSISISLVVLDSEPNTGIGNRIVRGGKQDPVEVNVQTGVRIEDTKKTKDGIRDEKEGDGIKEVFSVPDPPSDNFLVIKN